MRPFLLALLLFAAAADCQAAQDLVTVPTRSGVTDSYLVIQNKSTTPKIVVIAFVGGFGAIGLATRCNEDDGCPMSPYYNAERLSKSFPLVSFNGGDPPRSGPCDPQSPHGYFGKDAPVAQAMKSWMLGREFPREIR